MTPGELDQVTEQADEQGKYDDDHAQSPFRGRCVGDRWPRPKFVQKEIEGDRRNQVAVAVFRPRPRLEQPGQAAGIDRNHSRDRQAGPECAGPMPSRGQRRAVSPNSCMLCCHSSCCCKTPPNEHNE